MPFSKQSNLSFTIDETPEERTNNYVVGHVNLLPHESQILDTYGRSFGKAQLETLLSNIAKMSANIERDVKTRSSKALKISVSSLSQTVKHSFGDIINFFSFESDEENFKTIVDILHVYADKYIGAIRSVFKILEKARNKYLDEHKQGSSNSRNKNQSKSQLPSQTPQSEQQSQPQSQQSGQQSQPQSQPQSQQSGQQSGQQLQANDNTNGNTDQTNNSAKSEELLNKEKQDLDKQSLLNMLLLDHKAETDKKLRNKLFQKKHEEEHSSSASESTRWQTKTDSKQREYATNLLELFDAIHEEIGVDKAKFVEALVKQHEIMLQGAEELKIIAQDETDNSAEIETCEAMHNTLQKNLLIVKQKLACSGDSFLIVNKQLLPSGMLAKTLRKLRNMNTLDLHATFNKHFITTSSPKLKNKYGHSHHTCATHFIPVVNVNKFHPKLTLEELAMCISFYSVANMSDAVRYIEKSVAGAITQPLSFMSMETKHKQDIMPIEKLSDKVNAVVEQIEGAKDFSPEKYSSDQGVFQTSVPVRFPVIIEGVEVRQPVARVLEHMKDVTNQKVTGSAKSKLINFSSSFVETTSTAHLLSPFPLDYNLKSNGEFTASNISKYTNALKDKKFKIKVQAIENKLNTVLQAYLAAQSILEGLKNSCDHIEDVPLVNYEESGPKKSTRNLKSLLLQRISQTSQSLTLERASQISYANQAILNMLNIAKIDAIHATLIDSNHALTKIMQCLYEIEDFIPTDEEIIVQKSLDETQLKVQKISTSLTKHIIQAFISMLSFLSVPMHMLNSMINTIISTTHFESFYDMGISAIFSFAEKFTLIFAEIIDALYSSYDMYDTFVFKLEEYMPNIRFLAKASLFALISVVMIQNPVCFKLIEYLFTTLIPEYSYINMVQIH